MRISWCRPAVVALGIGLAAAAAWAQVPLNAPPPGTVADNLNPDLAIPAAPDSYVIGPEDVLSIFVYEMPEMTQQVRVDNSGQFQLPLLARPLEASGMTAPAVAREVSDRLEAARLANSPLVRVVVRQVASQLIVITGAVNHPTVVEADRPLTVAEAIARAGGLSDTAGDTVRITLRKAGSAVATQSLPLQPILQGQQEGPLLYGDATLEVAVARLVYVVGAVNKAGGFPIRVGEPITLLRALALAQGIRSPADEKHVSIIHPGVGSAPPLTTEVDLKAVLQHHAPDLQLAGGDVLLIPENGRSKALTMALNSITQTAVIAIGYNAAAIF